VKRILIDVPGMYADHHVLRVREALLGVQGVTEVKASAARRKVAVGFDEQTAAADTIRRAILSAGYALDEAPATAQFPQRHKDGSAWYSVLDRRTTTELKDREMAGDFRRY
jgi:copper chaperone CopZ